jgi:hypothetical protein
MGNKFNDFSLMNGNQAEVKLDHAVIFGYFLHSRPENFKFVIYQVTVVSRFLTAPIPGWELCSPEHYFDLHELLGLACRKDILYINGTTGCRAKSPPRIAL